MVREAVMNSGLEYTFLYSGAIMEGVLGPLTGIDITNGRAWLVGDGNARYVKFHAIIIKWLETGKRIFPERINQIGSLSVKSLYCTKIRPFNRIQSRSHPWSRYWKILYQLSSFSLEQKRQTLCCW